MFKKIVINPVSKPRMTQRDRWKTGPDKRPSVRAYHDFCDRLRKFKIDVDWENLRVSFYFPMPNSWSKTKRKSMKNKPHKQRPDIDNLCKSFMDAMLTEDSHVWNVYAKKFWGEEGCIIVKTN